MVEPNSASEAMVVDDDDYDSEIENEEEEEIMKSELIVNHEAKLRELLHRINSAEIRLCSDAAKEFIKLLRSDSGGEFLRHYVTSSPRCSELLSAWKLRQGKNGIWYVFKLISVLLDHPDGRYRPNSKQGVAISRVLDKFSRLIIDEHLQDVYKELNGKEFKSQNAALMLMASIVKRGSVLASEVAKSFDFKLKGFAKLAEYKKRRNELKVKRSSRKAFVRFAMSFLEVGKPGLLRWVLQQKEMYSGVLRVLGNEGVDDDETVVYVFTTLRDRILVEESLVPPGLRSVLFGSVTLERLVEISGRENGGYVAELAYRVLVLVCTDPCNGLMPDLERQPGPLRGNSRRLLGLMKKLKATEIVYHRDLLLAIVCGKPFLGGAFMEEFPCNLEDYASASWFSFVSLAANLVSSMAKGLKFDSLVSQPSDPHSSDSVSVQSIIKCLFPRSFSQSAITKGLLHSEFLVKHGTLRLLVEGLKLLDSLIAALDSQNSFDSSYVVHGRESLKQEIQNEVRMLLPSPQVLLTQLSSLSSHSKTREMSLKRKAPEHRRVNGKKLKKDNVNNEDSDIIISGISSSTNGVTELVETVDTVDDIDTEKDVENILQEIWGPELNTNSHFAAKDAEIYFESKLLDALKIYFKIMPSELEGLFEFLMKLLSDPLALPANLQRSLLSVLIEYVGFSNGIPTSAPPLMYKHLQSFISLLIFSPDNDIRDQAYDLAQAALLSTGAFDRNRDEVGSWFLFLPGYDGTKSSFHVPGMESLQSLCQVVISFLCDAVSTMSNSLFKYWDIVRSYTLNFKDLKDISPDFSPLVVCILQKCLRLLTSESETFKLPEKSIISLYVANTLKYILQTKADARLVAAVIDSILFEKLGEPNSSVDDSEIAFSEWRPLNNLFLFSRTILHQHPCMVSTDKNSMRAGSSFKSALSGVKKSLGSGNEGDIIGVLKTFSSSIICTMPEQMLKNFPSVMAVSQKLPIVTAHLLPSVFFLQQTLLTGVSNFLPEVFFPGLNMSLSTPRNKDNKNDGSLAENGCLGDFETSGNDAAAVTFSFFLKKAPFHVLFPSIMSTNSPYLTEPVKIKDLLLAKLSEWKSYSCAISNLRLLLFWIHQIHASYRHSPSTKFEELSEICFILLKHVLVQLLDSNAHVPCPGTTRVSHLNENIHEVAETIFCHPAVVTSISHPLNCDLGLTNANVINDMDTLIDLSRQNVHTLDRHVLDALVTTIGFLFSHSEDRHFETNSKNGTGRKLMKVYDALIRRILKEVKDVFKECIRNEDAMLFHPLCYAIHSMSQFISPFELLGLVKWMFKQINIDKLTGHESSKISAISFGFCFAIDAFRNISNYLMQPVSKRRKFDIFWAMEENKDVNIVEDIYIQMTRLTLQFETGYPHLCLLEAVNAAHRLKYIQHHSFHSLSLVMSRVVMNTSVKLISYCIDRTTKDKGKLLFLLTDMSSLHLSVFGDLFLGIISKDFQPRENKEKESFDISALEKAYLMLLPAALLYFNSNFMNFGDLCVKNFQSIPSFYSTILWNGFQNWKSFVSNEIFEEEFGGFMPSSCEELLGLVNDSLLGKSICMMQHHFALDGDSIKMKKRLRLFNSIFPPSAARDELLDSDFGELGSSSVNRLLNLINRLLGKVSFCRMLLFPSCYRVQSLPKEDKDSKATMEIGSTKEEGSRMYFVKILVEIWLQIVKKFPSVPDSYTKSRDDFALYSYLEAFILRSILELTTVMHDSLVQLESLPFVEQLMKAALRYRYEDPATLKMLQSIIAVLPEGKFSRDFYLQLLLSHSQFESTIQSVSNSINRSHIGAFLRPMPGILRYLAPGATDKNTCDENSEVEVAGFYSKQMEVIRLLRTLFLFKSDKSALDFGKSLGIKFRELHLLLLSSYGATLSELDLEIYNLISTIESIEGVEAENIAGFDYLWGGAALKIENEWALEHNTTNVVNDSEAVKEQRRNRFRENFPVDPKLCVSTVLYFPYDRTVSPEIVSLGKLQSENFSFTTVNCTHTNLERYDPVFILRFSIYCLSVGYIEPLEFASLGLLAIAFVSMSSPDEGIRRLAYNTLDKFKNALEQCKKRTDVTRIRLLLTSLQNGIEESWQRIPSIVSIFAAEASFILLDSSHDHYATLSRLLMNTSKFNMKNVPMFNDFFWSVSVNFRAERLWILRLLYVGLNFDDDALIYIRNSIFETLMSFYFSPLSDNESNDLILRIVKKSIKSYKLTRHLVENCGLFPWLSSVIFISNKLSSIEERKVFCMQLTAISEIVNGVISVRNVSEWLQKEALEQLMELASHLYRFLVDGVIIINQKTKLVDFILDIIASTLKMSHKRKIYQPHFNLSTDGLYKVCEITGIDDSSVTRASAESGLKAVLMSIPPAAIFSMGHERLQTFVTWAVSSALQADSAKLLRKKASQNSLSAISKEEQHESSLSLKLLRWLAASVIIGELSIRSNNLDPTKHSSLKDLVFAMECVDTAHEERSRDRVDCEKFFASTILFLQQLTPTNYKVLPSAASALSILLRNTFHDGDVQHVDGFQSVLESLWSKIRCPTEANSSWRWSFYQPWKDLSLELTVSEKIDEIHACQSLLFITSNLLGSMEKKSLQSLTEDVKHISSFKGEKQILTGESNESKLI